MKLDEFRLESYDDRHVLQMAIALYRDRYPDMYRETVDALALRLSRTQCQPGGCDLCEDYEPSRSESAIA
jgi:hypothetical protein